MTRRPPEHRSPRCDNRAPFTALYQPDTGHQAPGTGLVAVGTPLMAQHIIFLHLAMPALMASEIGVATVDRTRRTQLNDPRPVRKTIKEIFAKYGPIAVAVYFAIFFTALFGFWAAIHFGWRPASSSGEVGAFTAAYIATKVTQPLRIAATLALTPLIAKVYERALGRRTPPV